MQKKSTRLPLIKSEDGSFHMTQKNIQICNKNQDRYTTAQLNDAFELQYYGFVNIANLQPYHNINTLYLNNNVITKIQNLPALTKLVTLNLSNNRIAKIQNLNTLTQLFILDLSGNQIKYVENLQNLQKLTTLNLASNLIEKPQAIDSLKYNKALTCLNLSNNPLSQDIELFNYLQHIPLLTLFMKDTKFSRGVASYRKQTICRLKKITFLDQRPVTKDQRMMAQAWKEGGLQAQRQARKQIQQTKDQKNKKIYEQMMERSAKIQKLRDNLFQKLTISQHKQLQQLRKRYNQQTQNHKRQFQLNLINKQIQQLQMYLKLFRIDVNDMDVSQYQEVPNNLCQRVQTDAIYIYGVTQQQLPKIKEVYYKDDPRPLYAVDFKKKQQLRWVQNYDQILQQVCKQYFTKSQLIVPVFNIKIHQFDQENNRKCRRFKQEQIREKIFKYQKKQAQEQIKKEHQDQNSLNVLD